MKNQNEKISSLIQQALGAIKGNPSKDYDQVKSCLKQALQGLQKIQQKHNKKNKTKQNQFEQWWGNVQSGVTNSNFANMSKEAQLNSLNAINSLINVEKNKIDELEISITKNKRNESADELIIE